MYSESMYDYLTDLEKIRIEAILREIDALSREKYDIYNQAQARMMRELLKNEK